jgi:hypothetical protein
MMSCPLPFWGPASGPIHAATTGELAVMTALVAAVVAKLITAIVAHGALRPLMEARGVSPWGLKDSFGAIPLLAAGSALASGAAGYGAIAMLVPCPTSRQDAWLVPLLCLGLLAVGFLMLRLGTLALRKLV